MNLFTQNYKKARSVMTAQSYAADWEKFLKTDAPVPSLLTGTGPATAHADVTDKVRKKINDSTGYWFNPWGDDEGDVIWSAAASASGSQKERAATLKFVRHFYRFSKRGSQDVWIYNPPKKYTKFVFEEVDGTDKECKRKLAQKSELFSKEDMKRMSAALKMGLAAAQKSVVKLNSPDDTTKQKVKDWFCDDHGSEAQLNNAMRVLKAGMPKIVSCLNSNKLVFTDYPGWRADRMKYNGGAIRGGEGGGFPVIYIEGGLLESAGNSGMLWTCARTIVHEASHHELRTQDHKYRHQGLKPTGNKLSSATALDNADSWGCFAIDIDCKLSQSDKDKFLVEPS